MRAFRHRLQRLERRIPEASCDYCRPIFDGRIRIIEPWEPEPEPLPDACLKCGRERPNRVYFFCPRRAEDRPIELS
jgi:hypothetical protein